MRTPFLHLWRIRTRIRSGTYVCTYPLNGTLRGQDTAAARNCVSTCTNRTDGRGYSRRIQEWWWTVTPAAVLTAGQCTVWWFLHTRSMYTNWSIVKVLQILIQQWPFILECIDCTAWWRVRVQYATLTEFNRGLIIREWCSDSCCIRIANDLWKEGNSFCGPTWEVPECALMHPLPERVAVVVLNLNPKPPPRRLETHLTPYSFKKRDVTNTATAIIIKCRFPRETPKQGYPLHCSVCAEYLPISAASCLAGSPCSDLGFSGDSHCISHKACTLIARFIVIGSHDELQTMLVAYLITL